MKVRELIELLDLEDPEAEVVVNDDDNGERLGYVVDVSQDGDVIIFAARD